jgi:glycerol-3-phosphate dehydrogenase (NAD(P)+)
MIDTEVVIIGKGAWGQALETVLSQNVASVQFWNRKDTIRADILVLSLPVQSMRGALEAANPGAKVVVNTCKGIEQLTNYLPEQIVREVLGQRVSYYSLMGPSFASELMLRMPTLVNLGYRNGDGRDMVKKAFQTEYFRVHLTPSLEALEFFGAFKNVYAILCGLADGMGFGINTRVALISLALSELQRFFHKQDILFSPDAVVGTMGDLVLTCTSMESRNFRFGKLLVEYPVREAMTKVGATVEGYFTAMSVMDIVCARGVSLPLAELVLAILEADNPQTVRDRMLHFLQRV